MRLIVVAGSFLLVLILTTPVWGQQDGDPPRAVRPVPEVPIEHVKAQVRMTQQMGVMARDPRMTADPSWQRMQDDAHIRAEEYYQAQLDRMLPGRRR
jgi:hypothetical protein